MSNNLFYAVRVDHDYTLGPTNLTWKLIDYADGGLLEGAVRGKVILSNGTELRYALSDQSLRWAHYVTFVLI